MSGILPIGPAKKTGSISDSEIDPVCYNGILWHDNRANSRMPPSDGACRFGLPLAPIIEKGIIYWKPVGRPTQHKGDREVNGGRGAKSRREMSTLPLRARLGPVPRLHFLPTIPGPALAPLNW